MNLYREGAILVRRGASAVSPAAYRSVNGW